MFVGRSLESQKLEKHLQQTQAGRPVNFLLTGERGIGKTSLLSYLKYIAKEGSDPTEQNLSFLVIETDLDEKVDQLGLARKIELGIRHELAQTEKTRQFMVEAWKFLQRVEFSGFSLRPNQQTDENLLIEEFAHSLAATVNRITSPRPDDPFSTPYDGMLLLIDEADNCGDALRLGSFLKLLLERIQRKGCNRLMVGLAGLPRLRQILVDSHPSSLRLFEELPLDRLQDNEVENIIDIYIRIGNRENAKDTVITAPAKRMLVELSEGFPHFIQQFGYSALQADTDGIIDERDVQSGAFGPRGALDVIGDRYYRSDFYNKIQEESYREVLRIMADRQDEWVTKKEIRQQFDGKETTLDNALHALRERHMIISREGHRGIYRLQHRGFAMWIKLQAKTRDVAKHG